MNDNEEQLNNTILALKSQLQNINTQIFQLHRQKKNIENREKESARKARTHRLIQIGALAEKYLESNEISVEEIESLLAKIVRTEEIKSMLPEQNIKAIPAEKG
jgi:hypothetical protein